MKKPFLHLHLSLLFLMGCVFLLPSCIEDKAEDAAHRLVVSKVDVELIQTGMLNTGSKASFDVLANRGMSSRPMPNGSMSINRPEKDAFP
ncbi:MAG: hypothetical protein ACLUNS_06080 [Alistipes shahii]